MSEQIPGGKFQIRITVIDCGSCDTQHLALEVLSVSGATIDPWLVQRALKSALNELSRTLN